MNIVHMDRSTGKTAIMVAWTLAKDNRILITIDQNEAKRIIHEFPDLKHRVVSYELWINSPMRVTSIKEVPIEIGIDNAGIILRRLYGNVQQISVGVSRER